MAAFYADEHVPPALADRLRALGHDVLTALADGRANQRVPDADLLARAAALGRAVVTNNRRHYHALHRTGPSHAGIVTYTDDDPTAVADRVHAAVASASSLAGLLIRIVRPNPPRPQVP